MCSFREGLFSDDDDDDDNNNVNVLSGDVDNDITNSSSASEEVTRSSEIVLPNTSEEEKEKRGGSSNKIEEGEEEDDLVKALRAAKEKVRENPPDISFEDLIVDISFHPNNNIIAAGSVDGDVFLYKYDNNFNKLVNTLELHTKACRDIEFNDDGSVLYSCGKDKCIMVTDTETGKLKKFYEDAHEQPLYSLYVYNENTICTGDEEGTVKIWDLRLNNSIMSFKYMEEFVSDMMTTDAKKFLVCSCGDGTITSFNIPSKKMFVQSEDYNEELNCMQLLKHDTKLLVCSSKGKMYLYNWGEFGYHSDEYSGSKHSINSVLAITENIVVAGFDDGNIRAVNLFPHRHLGVVGQHQCSIESLDISYDGQFIASSSLDQSIKFWNIRYFEDVYVVKKKTNKKASLALNLPSSKVKNPADFFSELK